MQWIDLEPFGAYLKQRDLVDEGYLPYYLDWVRRLLQSGFDVVHLSWGDLLQCFSDQLARDESVADW